MRTIEAYGGPLDGAMVELPSYQPGTAIELDKGLVEQASAGSVRADDVVAVTGRMAVYRLKAGRRKCRPRLDFEGWA